LSDIAPTAGKAPEMRVSQNEIYRLCQRTLEGLGAPAGIDRDGAWSVAWLAARGLPGLLLLARDLERLDGSIGPLKVAPLGGRPAIDLAGQSALAAAGLILDYMRAVAAAATNRRTALLVARCRAPLFLLPMAVRASEPRGRFRFAWSSADGGTLSISVAAGMAAGTGIDGPAVLTDDRPVDVEIIHVADSTDPPESADSPVTGAIDEAAMTARLAETLALGIAVDPEIWARIGAVAARVLVPATAVSRERGAGGGDANA